MEKGSPKTSLHFLLARTEVLDLIEYFDDVGILHDFSFVIDNFSHLYESHFVTIIEMIPFDISQNIPQTRDKLRRLCYNCV